MAVGLADPTPRPAWADLRIRALSAVVLAPLVLAAIWLGGVVFLVLLGIVSFGLAYEWAGLCRAGRWRRESLVLGIGAVAVWAVALGWLRSDPLAGRANVIGLALVIWGSDIGAYLAGRLIGGPLLAPRISPGKTWAGAAGGVATAALIAAGAATLLTPTPNLPAALVVGAALSVCGQIGDLAESVAKRRAGVKDSGRLIPGHGGLLDRLDAVMAAVPAATLLSLVLGRGVVLWQ
ncbi:MAG: phosphatidate cytidylyltransferase [Acetobacteraceae bacterium]